MGSAVLTFHDAVELFLSLAAEHLNVGRSSLGFMEYFEVLKAPLGQDLAQKESMRRLNSARVGLKHSGTLPSKMSIEGFRASTTEFFETNVPTVFSVDFDSISLVDLVSGSAAYQHIRQAQDDVSQIRVSTDKIVKRGERIEALEFDEGEAEARAELLRLQGRNLRAVD